MSAISKPVLVGLVLATLSTLGCGPDREQRLDATGELVGADGLGAGPGLLVDHYRTGFVVADGIEIVWEYAEGIPADEQGWFSISVEDLELSYEWESDEEVCHAECLVWETTCYVVVEEVCEDTCTYQECTEECMDVCHDETKCETYDDEDGNPQEECWTESVCEQVCDTVCRDVTEDCNCHDQEYEQCEDACVTTGDICEWVTYSHTAYPGLDEVVATWAEIDITASDDQQHTIAGSGAEAYLTRECAGGSGCTPVDVWVQHDRFTLPF